MTRMYTADNFFKTSFIKRKKFAFHNIALHKITWAVLSSHFGKQLKFDLKKLANQLARFEILWYAFLIKALTLYLRIVSYYSSETK